jgi:polar amino acid transport system substrate-binding protein
MSRAEARDLKASLPFLPVLAESKDKGILVDLLKAMAKEYKDGKITWDVYPGERAMENIEKGKADFKMPMFVNPGFSQDKLPFQFSSESLFRVMCVLYTNKNNKEINPGNVRNYKIESGNSLKDFFGFPVGASPNLESGLRKVDIGRIDGFISPMVEADQILKTLGLKNVKRWKYKKFDVKMVVQKGAQGKEVDRILSDIIKKLKTRGEYQTIMGPILDEKFEEWQL